MSVPTVPGSGPFYLPRLLALGVVGVVDPGVPNKERVYLYARTDARLGEYFLFTGVSVGSELVHPTTENVMWLGNMMVPAESWVLVYTGPGEQRITTFMDKPVLVLHWGKRQTIFGHPSIRPVLVHVDSVEIGRQVGTQLSGQQQS